MTDGIGMVHLASGWLRKGKADKEDRNGLDWVAA